MLSRPGTLSGIYAGVALIFAIGGFVAGVIWFGVVAVLVGLFLLWWERWLNRE